MSLRIASNTRFVLVEIFGRIARNNVGFAVVYQASERVAALLFHMNFLIHGQGIFVSRNEESQVLGFLFLSVTNLTFGVTFWSSTVTLA
jgi:hypothetical protein